MTKICKKIVALFVFICIASICFAQNVVTQKNVTETVTDSKSMQFATNISGKKGDVICFAFTVRGADAFKQIGLQTRTLDNEAWHDVAWSDAGIENNKRFEVRVSAQSDFDKIDWKVFVQIPVSAKKRSAKVTLADISVTNTSGSANNKSAKNATNQNNAKTKMRAMSANKNVPKTEAFDFLDQISVGWNLGNALDSYSNGVAKETAWGNPTVTKKIFEGVKKAGFGAVRIPTTWLGHVGSAPSYKIEEKYLNRVKEVVGFARDAGLKVIINIHHDGADSAHWLDIKNGAKQSAKNTAIKEQLTAMWTQIAKSFPSSSDYLIFEVMNEIHDGGWGWGANRSDGGAQYRTLNEWNQVCVDAIRKTGAKNYISVPGYVTDPELTIQNFKLPKDDLNKLFVTVHFYAPTQFCLDATVHQWGESADKDALRYQNQYSAQKEWITISGEEHVERIFADLYNAYVAKGVPVLVSECGAVHQSGYEDFRRYYMEFMVRTARINGLLPILWDNGSSASGRECSGLFNRRTGEIYAHAKTVVDAVIRAATTDAREISLP